MHIFCKLVDKVYPVEVSQIIMSILISDSIGSGFGDLNTMQLGKLQNKSGFKT